MSIRFETRPILLRNAVTATLQGAVHIDWGAQVGLGLHLFCIVAAAVVARNVANQQVLDVVGAHSLGTLYLITALLSAFLLVAFGVWSRGSDTRRLMRTTHLGLAALMILASLLPQRPATVLFKYVSMEVAAAVSTLVFGLLLGSRFSPREARRAAARIGTGGILGGLAAGAILSIGAPLLGSRWLFAVAGGIMLLPLALQRGLGPQHSRVHVPRPTRLEPDVNSLAAYGRWVALTTVVMVATTTLVDYQFRLAAKHYFGADDLTAFFGFVVLATGLVTLLFQLTLLDRLLERLGLFATAALMPAVLLLGGSAFGIIPSLATLAVFKLLDSGANMSVQQATSSLLFAPLATRARSLWQSRVDGLAKRGGQALMGLVLAALPWTRHRALPLILALCALWLVALAITRRRYVRLLTDMLRQDGGVARDLPLGDSDSLRLLEGELANAPLPRAAVVLDLLAETGHRASPNVLALLESRGGGAGALLVIEHLAEFADVRAIAVYVRHADPQVVAEALLTLALLDMTTAQRHARALLGDEQAASLVRATTAGLLAASDERAGALARRYARATERDLRLVLASALDTLSAGGPTVVAELVAELACDDDKAVARAALSALTKQPSAAGTEVAIAALRRRDRRAAAMRALAACGSPATERVADELLAELDRPHVAAALSWVLGRLGTSLAIKTLTDAVAATNVEVRLSAAMALNSLRRRRPNVAIDMERIEGRFRPELDFHLRMRRACRLPLPDAPISLVLLRSLKQRAQASLECVFRLLALQYPEDVIRTALAAIASGDRDQRQLALELLDAVLEAPLRHAFSQIASDASLAEDSGVVDMGGALRELVREGDSFLSELARLTLIASGGRAPPSRREREFSNMTMSQSLVRDILELQSVTVFGESSAEDLAELITLLSSRAVTRDAVIFREGDPGDALYLIRTGRVTLSSKGQAIEQLGPGEAFGVVSVLDRKPREISATATTDCELRVLAADDLMELLNERPALMHSVFRALTQAIRNQIDRIGLGRKSA